MEHVGGLKLDLIGQRVQQASPSIKKHRRDTQLDLVDKPAGQCLAKDVGSLKARTPLMHGVYPQQRPGNPAR